jgi:hypothetical protein
MEDNRRGGVDFETTGEVAARAERLATLNALEEIVETTLAEIRSRDVYKLRAKTWLGYCSTRWQPSAFTSLASTPSQPDSAAS